MPLSSLPIHPVFRILHLIGNSLARPTSSFQYSEIQLIQPWRFRLIASPQFTATIRTRIFIANQDYCCESSLILLPFFFATFNKCLNENGIHKCVYLRLLQDQLQSTSRLDLLGPSIYNDPVVIVYQHLETKILL